MNRANIYTKENCPFCVQAKQLLSENQIGYTETVIGKDLLREDFMSTFPGVSTAPLIIIDGVKIGGYDQLKEHFSQQSFLTE